MDYQQPPAQVEPHKDDKRKQAAQKPEVHQESRGANSPNIVVGDHGSVIITQVQPQTTGFLSPANDPMVQAPAWLTIPIPDNALRMYLGEGCAYTTRDSIVILRIAGKDLLTMKRSAAGILMGAKVFSKDERIVAEIEDNEFTVNPNNYFKIKHPDASTLVVYDQYDDEALNVRYANSHMLRVTGRFYSPRGLIQITPAGLVIPGNNTIRFGYMAANGIAAFAFE